MCSDIKKYEYLKFKKSIIEEYLLLQDEYSKIYNNDKKIAFIKSLKKTQTWQTILRNENDYLAHSTEVIIPTHTSGHFLILASENKSLTQAKIYGTAFIQITDLTLIENNFNEKIGLNLILEFSWKIIKIFVCIYVYVHIRTIYHYVWVNRYTHTTFFP